MINAKVVVGAILVLMVFCVPCGAYYITGNVSDCSTGEKLDGVFITILNNSLSAVNDTTNTSGMYVLYGVTNGSHYVHAYRGDYQANTAAAVAIWGNDYTCNNITLLNYKLPKTASSVPNVSEDAADEFTDALGGGNWTDNLFNFSGAMLAISMSYTAVMGNLFFLFLFGAPFLMAWLGQANAAIPTVWGLVVGGTMLLFLPLEYRFVATLILVLAIVGGLWMVFKERF